MNTYTLKNFRVFDEEGATFNIAPLTILTGCNSSGKSSVTKSLMLINDLLKRIHADYYNGNRCFLEDYRLNVTKSEYSLGGFESVINKDSKEKEFSISYTGRTYFYEEDISVTFTFVPDKDNHMGEGRIKTITLHDAASNTLIFSVDLLSGEAHCNLALLKEKYLTFAQSASYFNEWQALDSEISLNQANNRNTKKETIEHYHKLLEILGDEQWAILKVLQTKIIKRDSLNKLVGSCNYDAHHLEHKSLFYLPILSWFAGKTKEEVSQLLEDKVNSHHYEVSARSQEEYEKRATEVLKRFVVP